jgi:ATP-dependent DNA helicase RecQ
MPETPLSLLNRLYGYPAFRGEQQVIIERIAAGGDALVLMPTGGGKSLCYQIPALLRSGVGVVVSPLIALMHDQVGALRELGIAAAFLNSSLNTAQAATVERDLLEGRIKLLYVAPERLLMPRMLALLDRVSVALFAIDEAHCVSQWGHDFRPEYLGLALLAERYPGVPRLALTATADTHTRAEMRERLALNDARMFIASFDRPNIRYNIVEKTDARRQLLAFLRDGHIGEAGIVYCNTRNKVEDTAAWLCGEGVRALPYHAGFDASIRRRHQDSFLREDGVVMVATIAFGMGIDKPDVRFVAHLDLPRSMEGYYQETGRAGRDGEPAQAWMAWGMTDVATQRRFIEESEAGPTHKRTAHAKLDALLALVETATCRRQVLLDYFGEQHAPCGNCDTCLEPPRLWDGSDAARRALSAIYRTDQRFGAAHVIDVLMGRGTDKIAHWEHHKLSVFGIGADMSEKRWRAVLRQLVLRGLLNVDHGAYGALTLTDAARPVLRGEEKLWLRELPERAARVRKVRASAGEHGLEGRAAERFERLRAWRREAASTAGVPAYVILHDATLREIAQAQPGSLEALGMISGIGAKKLEAHGQAILELLAEG